MDKRKLLIADSSEELYLALVKLLQADYTMKYCADGQEALRMLRAFRPEVLVLDLTLPELDGISLLERAAQEGFTPMVLAATRYPSDYVQETLELLGVGYLMMKPCDVAGMANRVRDLTKRLKPADPRVRIIRILNDLSFRSKHDGRDYLIEAVLLMYHDPSQAITKELYPAIARRAGVSDKVVERSIRTAIENAWKNRDEQLWREYFPAADGYARKKPTNGDIILDLADYLKTCRL